MERTAHRTLLLLLLLLYILVCFSAAAVPQQSLPRHIGILIPDDPIGIIGSTRDMTCILNDSVIKSHGLNATKLSFLLRVKANGKSPKVVRIAKSRIQVHNSTVAVATISCKEEYDTAVIVCNLRWQRAWHMVDEQYFEVGVVPIASTYSQIVNHNFDWLEFRWSRPNRSDRYIVTYNAWYKKPHEDVFKRCPKGNVCTIEHPASNGSGYYTIKVNASNLFGEVESPTMHVNLHQVLMPAVVESLMVEIINSTNAKVTWKSPLDDVATTSLHYQVEYWTEWDETPQVKDIRPHEDYDLVDEVLAFYWEKLEWYTNHTVRVRSCPAGFTDPYWSEWKETSFQTRQDVPGEAPHVTLGGFEIKVLSTGPARDVILHWRAPSQRHLHGKLAEYRVRYSDPKSHQRERENVSASKNSAILTNLSLDEEYPYIVIDAKTEAGYNESLALVVMRIPANSEVPSKPRNFTAIARNQTTVRTSWSKKQMGQEDDVTIFYCKGTQNVHTCTAELQFHTLPANCGNPGDMCHYDVQLQSGSYTEYLFGISHQVKQGSTGITWTSCNFKTSAVSPPPRVDIKTLEDTIITLSLEKPSCAEGRGYIYAYYISYCSIDNRGYCKGSINSRSVESELSEYQITDLQQLTQYAVNVSSLSQAGMSRTRNTVTGQTLSGGLTKGPITGIVVAAVVVLIFVGLGIKMCCKYQQQLIKKWRIWHNLPIEHPADLDMVRLPLSSDLDPYMSGEMLDHPRKVPEGGEDDLDVSFKIPGEPTQHSRLQVGNEDSEMEILMPRPNDPQRAEDPAAFHLFPNRPLPSPDGSGERLEPQHSGPTSATSQQPEPVAVPVPVPVPVPVLVPAHRPASVLPPAEGPVPPRFTAANASSMWPIGPRIQGDAAGTPVADDSSYAIASHIEGSQMDSGGSAESAYAYGDQINVPDFTPVPNTQAADHVRSQSSGSSSTEPPSSLSDLSQRDGRGDGGVELGRGALNIGRDAAGSLSSMSASAGSIDPYSQATIADLTRVQGSSPGSNHRMHNRLPSGSSIASRLSSESGGGTSPLSTGCVAGASHLSPEGSRGVSISPANRNSSSSVGHVPQEVSSSMHHLPPDGSAHIPALDGGAVVTPPSDGILPLDLLPTRNEESRPSQEDDDAGSTVQDGDGYRSASYFENSEQI